MSDPDSVIIDADVYDPMGSGAVEVYIYDPLPAAYVSINTSLVYGGAPNAWVVR